MKKTLIATAIATCGLAGTAQAQISGDVVKIGIITDMSSVYADIDGAGRTTTLRAILGLTGARKGSIKIHGEETINLSTHRIANLGIGYCPEERGIFASLTAEENLRLPPPLKSQRGKVMSEAEIYAMFPNLAERRHSPGTRLSGGEQQMLAVARILRTGADILLLD